MPRSISTSNLAALKERRLVARDFLWIEAKAYGNNIPVTDGTWSGNGNISAQVIDPDTGLTVSRDWYGSGTLIQIGDIPLVSNLSVQRINAIASQIHEHVAILVRQYDLRQAKVQIFRGLFNPETRLMVAPAECRFVGLVDDITITTPSENDEGMVSFSFVSQTQDLTRANTETRSHEMQRLRDPNDDFYIDSSTVTTWKLFWGSQQGEVPTQKRKKFLGIF